MESSTKEIMDELKRIRIDINFIKQNMVDVDTLLTPEEETNLNLGLKEFKERKTTSLDDFEKEMGKNVQC
jgi:hypothetical protein